MAICSHHRSRGVPGGGWCVLSSHVDCVCIRGGRCEEVAVHCKVANVLVAR